MIAKIRMTAAFLIVSFASSLSAVFAGSSLNDWAFRINDSLYSKSFPASADHSQFDPNTGLGRIVVSFDRGSPGNYVFRAFFDHEIDESLNGFTNEYGEVAGTPAAGQSWEIDEPGYRFGDIYTHFLSGNLENANAFTGGLRDDVSMAMGWAFTLAAHERGIVTINLATQVPSETFYLKHTDPESVSSIYFSGSLQIDAETISTPNIASGPGSGITGASYAYTVGGSVSSAGDPVEYLIDWGDETNSGWLGAGALSASKTWNAVGTYQVKVMARCATHTGAVSSWSEPLAVNIQASSLPYHVETNPPGLQCVVDGISYTSPAAFNWTPGSNHTVSVASPQEGSSGWRYAFTGWSDGGAMSHSVTAPSGSATYTASFSTQCRLTTSVNRPEWGNVNPAGASWYALGESALVRATAYAGCRFANWAGDISGSENPVRVVMNGPANVEAVFQSEEAVSVAVPAVKQWGIAVLLVLIGLAAIRIIKRRRIKVS